MTRRAALVFWLNIVIFIGSVNASFSQSLANTTSFASLVDTCHQHAAVVTQGADDQRRLHVMLVEALLDNRRQGTAQSFRSSASVSVERDDLASHREAGS